VIAESIQELGWRRVVISLRDENLAIRSREDIVCAGLTPEEKDFLWRNQSPEVWRERFGPQYQRFKIGQFYYLPWSDPWVRERFEATTIPSKLASEDMVNWDPQDILYAPLTLADGKIVGIVSIDDPVDGKKPARSSLAPLELFLTQAAVAIENAQLIQELNKATNQIKGYAELLEQRVEQRTKELIESQNKLIKSERFAAIGEVAAMVGHDLRNPLQVIVYTLFLANEMFKRVSPEVRKIMDQQGVIEMLERIGEQVTYMNKIVSDLQDYAKPLKPELLETSLLQVINTILVTITVPENIKVNIEVTDDFPKIPMDKAMIRRVLTNLITNAIQAMPDGGELKITSSIEGDMAVISVKDTGVGMAKENIDKLFQPFYTTKSKGQGLGLAVSKRLIDAHDGFITVESEVNKGSTFTIKLPFRKLKYSQNG
jgi:signal transduction histidine kinase